MQYNALQILACQCIAKISISMHCKDQQFIALQRSACHTITQIIIAMHCKDKQYKDQHDNVLQRSAFHLHYKDQQIPTNYKDPSFNAKHRSTCQCITKISLSMHYKDQHCLYKKSHGLQYVDKLNQLSQKYCLMVILTTARGARSDYQVKKNTRLSLLKFITISLISYNDGGHVQNPSSTVVTKKRSKKKLVCTVVPVHRI